MHSSRMRTAHSSSRRGGGGLPQCMLGYTPPGVGLETPPGCGPGDPLGVGLETPVRPDPSTSPLGVGLETCKACWDTKPPAARHAGIPPAMHVGIPLVDRILDACY